MHGGETYVCLISISKYASFCRCHSFWKLLWIISRCWNATPNIEKYVDLIIFYDIHHLTNYDIAKSLRAWCFVTRLPHKSNHLNNPHNNSYSFINQPVQRPNSTRTLSHCKVLLLITKSCRKLQKVYVLLRII